MTLNRRSALAGLALLAAAPSAFARPPVFAPLSADDQALVSKAATYLQGLTAAKGRFIQTDARGSVTQGTFLLQRPGKARFAYDPPAGLTMASNGSVVAILNTRLKTFESYPLGVTPLSIFLAKEIRLDRGVVISRVDRKADGFSILARDGKRQAEGQIELTFADAPMQLTGWTLIDAQGQPTRVQLQDFAPSGPLGNSQFELRNPYRVAPIR
jgi:outer membrane lipoprotein-sorting protein